MVAPEYDVIIIGAGPIGLACGIEAQKKGLRHLILEKGSLVNSIFHYPTNMTFFSTSDRLEIGDVPFISHGMKPTRREALEYYRRVMYAWNLNVHTYEKATAVQGAKGDFTVVTSKDTYRGKYVIMAIGFFDFPNEMQVPGETLPKVRHYYDEPHPYVDQKVVVVGGGNSAVDVALETYRCGSDVTMVIQKDRLEENVKYWVKPDIENRIQEGVIRAYFNATLREIREKEVDILTQEGVITMANDFVLAMTGYHPDFDFLHKTGITFSEENAREPLYDPDTFQTNVDGIFLAGVVCCGMDTGKWFIENSRYHAENIFKYLGGEKQTV